MRLSKTPRNVALTAVCALLSLPVQAANFAVYDNKTPFLAATSATSATGPLPNLGVVWSGTTTIGSVTFSGVGGWTFYVGLAGSDWTTLLPGNEIAINSTENLDVGFANPVYSAGFEFTEPLWDANSPYVGTTPNDSPFIVTLKLGTASIGSFGFNAPDNVASFVGVWSDTAFDRMEIREVTPAVDDEYFGEFYTGSVAMPVPEPETYAMLLAGLGLVGFAVRRRLG